ncbi:hypothetical protein GIB67_021046 [Kingdonia uniflora]|uniref:ABC transporter domain-containing protein n=1 Tax=Kingdonia uniflora TaxID=39325 RepID=A0A7J7N6Y1_9MAGN|nr:hypothetical protein GIB67_021046 [Kingdonia uniflora]
MANAHEFISKFPKKYPTFVGECGLRLSGGQKQRIEIARARLMSPRILLLDEATSTLDTEGEYLDQDAMDSLIKRRTVLVIAHRLSTVKSVDTVVVISEGQIVKSGSHEELLYQDDIYTALIKSNYCGELTSIPNLDTRGVVYIPVGGSLQNSEQKNLIFGAAASMVHPITCYSVVRSLTKASKYATTIAKILEQDKYFKRVGTREKIAENISMKGKECPCELLSFTGKIVASRRVIGDLNPTMYNGIIDDVTYIQTTNMTHDLF